MMNDIILKDEKPQNKGGNKDNKAARKKQLCPINDLENYMKSKDPIHNVEKK